MPVQGPFRAPPVKEILTLLRRSESIAIQKKKADVAVTI
jgi:hypothetical protein